MAVNGEPCHNIRSVPQHDPDAQNGGGNGKNDRFDIAGGHKGDNDERYKKDQRRAEITDKYKRAYTCNRKTDKGKYILARLYLFQRSGAYEYKRHLYEFRGLERDPVLPAYRDPVPCAVCGFRNDQIYQQQQKRRDCHGQPQLHTKVHIAEQKYHNDINDHAGNDHKALLERRRRAYRTDHGDTRCAKEERDHLKLKITPVHRRVKHDKVCPLNNDKYAHCGKRLILNAEFRRPGGGKRRYRLKQRKKRRKGKIIDRLYFRDLFLFSRFIFFCHSAHLTFHRK